MEQVFHDRKDDESASLVCWFDGANKYNEYSRAGEAVHTANKCTVI